MKRICSTVFICIAVLVLLVYPSASASNAVATNAASPTPTTAASLPTNPTIIPNGVINERIDNTYESEANATTRTPSGVPTPTPQYSATVPPVDVSTKNFNIPKLDEIADWLTNVTRFMSAKQIKDNVTRHQNNLYISGQARRCITVAGFVIPDLPDQIGNKYKTGLVEYLPKLITATGLLSAQTVRNTVSLTNGKYNFEGPSYEVDGPPPCDAREDVGTPQEPKQIVLVQGQGFNFIQWVISQIKKFTIRTVFVSKQLCPECERIHCLLTGCVKGSVDLAYMDNPEKQKIVQKSGGIADAFRTVNMDTTKGESPHGQEENFTKTNTSYTKQMENSADLIKCSLVPPAQRGKVALANEDCKGFVKEITSNNDCSNSTYFTELYVNHPPTSTSGATGDPGYTIPYRSTACTIADDKMDPIALFAGQWGSGGANAEENIKNNWQTIQDISTTYGWNPLFIIALWIEESGAGATANAGWHLGCLYGWKQDGTAVSMPKINIGGTICDQMACLFSHPSQDPANFARFMCSYNTTAIQNGQCPSYPNWAFADQIYMVYQRLLNLTGNPSGCGFTEVHR